MPLAIGDKLSDEGLVGITALEIGRGEGDNCLTDGQSE